MATAACRSLPPCAPAVFPRCRRYGQDQWTLFKACLGRQTKLFMRNRAFIAIRM